MSSGRPALSRELGQHFLVDENILGVIGRLADLGADDVVLEVGAGLGVLTRYLADRVRHVEAVEVDRSLESGLRQAVGERRNVTLVFADALDVINQPHDPEPNKLVANLPYQIATPLVVESLDSLDGLQTWCVMLQREVADRFFAATGTSSYGAVSVLVQLTAKRTGSHVVARTCFRPPPNVDSKLVSFVRQRSWNDELRNLKGLVRASFAHRRKTLANSLQLSGYVTRDEAIAALQAIGRRSDTRAETLEPAEYPMLLAALP